MNGIMLNIIIWVRHIVYRTWHQISLLLELHLSLQVFVLSKMVVCSILFFFLLGEALNSLLHFFPFLLLLLVLLN